MWQLSRTNNCRFRNNYKLFVQILIMIVVKLIGGLGNQLFQYAIAKHLSLINNTNLLLDTTAFEDFYKLHKYSLQHFSIDAAVADRTLLDKIYKFPYNLNKIQKIWNVKILGKQFYHLSEKEFNYQNDILKKYNGYVLLDGYWQTEKYFHAITNILRKDLQIITMPQKQDLEIIHQIKNTNSISLHIRRADYTNAETISTHGLCSLDYYIKGVKFMCSKIKKPIFFVFSDDITWAKENLILEFPTVFVGHNSADKNYEDLRLMSICQHNIIANSSFSWWGAWLNTNPNKIVIAPEEWFATTERNYQDVIPSNWIKI